MKFITDFLFGKEITEEVDLKPTTATVQLTTHAVFCSRSGKTINFGDDFFLETGEDQIKYYLQNKEPFFEDDNGVYYPKKDIIQITFVIKPGLKKITYRK